MPFPCENPHEARDSVRRHAHDIRNMLNCMDLEIACMLEDHANSGTIAGLRRLREHVAVAERIVFSMSVRFREPSIHAAAAVDIYNNWRQQLLKLGLGTRFRWEEAASTAAISADFTSVIAVLVEVCIQFTRQPDTGAPAVASLVEEGPNVAFTVVEPPLENRFPVDPAQVREWERIISLSGGNLECSSPAAGDSRATRIVFPASGF